MIDAPQDVREGAGFDVERLAAWVKVHAPELDGALQVQQFRRGYSNLTYLVSVGEHELVLRRAPPGVKIASAHDMGREHRILSGLCRVWDKAPRPVALCEDPDVIGSPFYLMARVRGVILRAKLPKGVALPPDAAASVAGALARTLAEIHAVDLDAAGLADLGRAEGYVQRQVDGWARRYQAARTDDVDAMDRVGAWLAANRPTEAGAVLVHNDLKHDNVVLDPDDLGQVRAVLDWEMATLGCPLMDLGTSLSYWVQADDPPLLRAARFGPTDVPGAPTRAAFAAAYAEASGRTLPDLRFYYAFGLYKLAVIAQQLYARHVRGLTTDPRMAGMLLGVQACAAQAERAIADGLA